MLDMIYDPPREGEKSKSWKWMVIDSLIIALIAFVASLPSNRLPNLTELYVALKAFAYAFLIQLAVERGLKPAMRKPNNNK